MLTGSRRYSSRMVENYLKYKLDYPVELINFLYYECSFSWESVIADIGAGTGAFTSLLLERGSRVVAIEPNRELREIAERILTDEFPRYVSLEGSAENTTLSDASVNHIVCAQSFHFFDTEKCKREFSRILQPEGFVVLIGMMPVCDDEFSKECAALIGRYAQNPGGMGGGDLDSLYSGFFGRSCQVSFAVDNQLSLDFDSFNGMLLSSYCLPQPGEEGHDDLMEELELLFELYQQSGKVAFKYALKAYAGKPGEAG